MNLSLFSLENKVAVVTGAGKGIGKSVALGLADAGASVLVAARTIADINATAEEIKTKGVHSIAVPADVRVKDQVEHMVEAAVKEFGRIDILVNNAGGTFNASLVEMRENGGMRFSERISKAFFCAPRLQVG
jgi:7-alpha-hydroxysteroid dehydrogenase